MASSPTMVGTVGLAGVACTGCPVGIERIVIPRA
jgi:hypothetical protein